MADTQADDKKRSSITQRFRESLRKMGPNPTSTDAKPGSLSARDRTYTLGLKGLTRRHSQVSQSSDLEEKLAWDTGKPATHDPKAEVAMAADELHSVAHVKVTAAREEDGAKFSPQSAVATTGTGSLPASPHRAAAAPVAAAAQPPAPAAAAVLPRTPETVLPRTPEAALPRAPEAAGPRTPEVVLPGTPEAQAAAAAAAAEAAGGLDLQQLLQQGAGPVPVVETPDAAADAVQVDPQPVRRGQRGQSLLARVQLLGIAVVAGALSAAAFESSRADRAPKK